MYIRMYIYYPLISSPPEHYCTHTKHTSTTHCLQALHTLLTGTAHTAYKHRAHCLQAPRTLLTSTAHTAYKHCAHCLQALRTLLTSTAYTAYKHRAHCLQALRTLLTSTTHTAYNYYIIFTPFAISLKVLQNASYSKLHVVHLLYCLPCFFIVFLFVDCIVYFC